MYSSIVRVECSVSLTTDESRKVASSLPLEVLKSSIRRKSKSSLALYPLSRKTRAAPFTSLIAPISAACATALIVLDDAKSAVASITNNFKPIIVGGALLLNVERSPAARLI